MIYLKVCFSAYKILRESCVGQLRKRQNNNASSLCYFFFKNQHRLKGNIIQGCHSSNFFSRFLKVLIFMSIFSLKLSLR